MRTHFIKFITAICLFIITMVSGIAVAAPPESSSNNPTILFVPQDSRPVSDKQTVEVIENLGYKVITPPQDFLGQNGSLGEPDKLWSWVIANAPFANAAVLSSDALLYGSLVGSRKHDYTQAVIMKRVRNFQDLRQTNPSLPLYVFGSIMRTPRSGTSSGTQEPNYYDQFGADIFRYTALADKADMIGLTPPEQKESDQLSKKIPPAALTDWLERRGRNFTATELLIQLTRHRVLDYFALGRDDTAPYSQTHKESRLLSAEGKDIGPTRFQSMAGIDEFGMLLMARAVNILDYKLPFVATRYNRGSGENTIPAYSDETIGATVRSHIRVAGGLPIPSINRADMALFVNTSETGNTGVANGPENSRLPHSNTDYFIQLTKDTLKDHVPVSIADISFSNGADNSLMAGLEQQELLTKLTAYSGWNTGTNSTGFAIAEGMLASSMTAADRRYTLITRYMDDWAYQANVRQSIINQLSSLPGNGDGLNLGSKQKAAESIATLELRQFAVKHLTNFNELADLTAQFPWQRTFEIDVHIARSATASGAAK